MFAGNCGYLDISWGGIIELSGGCVKNRNFFYVKYHPRGRNPRVNKLRKPSKSALKEAAAKKARNAKTKRRRKERRYSSK